MTHEYFNTSAREMRKFHPKAMIIRWISVGHFVVFDNVADALGHWSAKPL